MPWASRAQQAWGHAHFSKERAAEWDAATDFSKLPDRTPGKQREATRKSGRKKGLARLTKMAGLGCLFMGCHGQPPPISPAQALVGANCKDVYDRAIEQSSTCPEAQLKVDSSDACKAVGGINLHCKEQGQ